MNPLRIILILLLSQLIACSPIYKVNTNYIPPGAKAGLQCVKSECRTQELSCQNQCNDTYNQCKSSKKVDATHYYDKYHQQQLNEYDRQYINYRNEQEVYDLKRALLLEKKENANQQCHNKKHSDKEHYCKEYKSYRYEINRLKRPYRPEYPLSLDETINNYQNQCQQSCNHCVDSFDRCYIGCGGQITKERVCVSNCK